MHGLMNDNVGLFMCVGWRNDNVGIFRESKISFLSNIVCRHIVAFFSVLYVLLFLKINKKVYY